MQLAAICLLVGLQSSAQPTAPPFRGEINLVGGVQGICISQGGDIWFVTSKGRAYRSRDRGELWTEVSLPVANPDDDDLSADRLEHVGFLDALHGVISGYVGENHDRALVTEDGGASWKSVQLPEELWVYDAWYGPGRNVWLVGSTGSVIHSSDSGRSWAVWSHPFDGESRSASICARDERDVVVASLEGSIVVTSDGGANWKAVRAPGGRLGKLFFVGNRLVCSTADGIRICDDVLLGDWRDLQVESEPCVRVAPHPDGMLAQLASHGAVLLDDALATIRRWPGRLEETATRMACSKDFGVALLDPEGSYAILDDKGLRSLRMLSASATPVWPMDVIDRAASGPMFGISKWGLYESTDEGKIWQRVQSLEDPEAVYAFQDGSGALVRIGGKARSWSSKGKSVTDIPGLDAFNWDFEVVRREPLWLAAGSRHDDDEATLRMLHTSDTVEVGPGFEALVSGSADGGRSWHELLRVPGCTIHATFLSDDNVLSLLLTSGEVARLPITLEPAHGDQPRLPRLGSVTTQAIRPMPQWGCWLEFVGGKAGELGGNTFFGGPIVQRTDDGGKTWTPVPQAEDRMREELRFLRLGGGSWLRLSIPYKQPSRVDVWKGREFQMLKQLEGEIHDAHIDAAGRLVLRLEDGAVRELSADGSAWKSLSNTPIPGR